MPTVPSDFFDQLGKALRTRWRAESRQKGVARASATLVGDVWGFLRDSTPERRRQRYGDMEYDWQRRVNTTSGSIGWQERLLGVFHSPYQPTDPALFQEMMALLPIDFSHYTFVDIGSGKGRTLLMASEYPFRRIIGVEVLPALHRAAEENIRAYASPTQRCAQIESICADAREFALPAEPLVLYLFNPLPQEGLERVLAGLEQSLITCPRPVIVIYHHLLFEGSLLHRGGLNPITQTDQFAIFSTI